MEEWRLHPSRRSRRNEICSATMFPRWGRSCARIVRCFRNLSLIGAQNHDHPRTQEETAQLPETWFSEVPGSLTDSEVRLFALLMVCHHRNNADAVAVTGFVDAPERTDVLGEWVQRVLASVGSTDFGNRLLNATKQRGNGIDLVGNALAGLPGVGQIARAPSRNSLSRYLDRIQRDSSRRLRMAYRRPLHGPARPCGKGGHSTRVSHAARRVAELLNGPDRETLADALITYTPSAERNPLRDGVPQVGTVLSVRIVPKTCQNFVVENLSKLCRRSTALNTMPIPERRRRPRSCPSRGSARSRARSPIQKCGCSPC